MHVIGACVKDLDAAAEWIAHHNQSVRFGKAVLIGDHVVCVHHLFESGVSHHGVRSLIGVLVAESRSFPDLAERTGALRPADAAALGSHDD